MMIGSWRWNAGIGAAAMLITFMLSLSNNVWTTVMIDSLCAFAIMFAATYGFRWLLGTAAGLKGGRAEAASRDAGEEAGIGTVVDMASEPGEDVNELIKNQIGNSQAAEFTPLDPPRLVTKGKIDAQKMADAVRVLAEGEEGKR